VTHPTGPRPTGEPGGPAEPAWLAGRGAVVTGGGRGIGAAIARALAAAGAGVLVTARTRNEIDAVAGELRGLGARAHATPCDVTDEECVRALGRDAVRALGAVDILINNAGVSASAPLARITLDDWNRMLAVNATGAFLCMREFLPGMVGRGWGRVVNIASVTALAGARYVAHYAASKHALLGLTRSVALEVADAGVTVNAVCPGYVDSPMTEATLAGVQARVGLGREEALAAVLATTGQERLVAPAEVAAAVVDICRDAAGGVTGRAISIPTKEPST